MRWLTSFFGSSGHDHPPIPAGQLQPAQDASAAIEELTRAIKHNPEAVELCSALGNLYRLRGEFDRAIQIRTALVSRPHLSAQEKARIYFELGRDYSRTGLVDRAQDALLRSRELGGTAPDLERELAELFAKGGQFLEASRLYKSIGAIPQAAHFLVRAACSGDGSVDRGLLGEALEMYPPSPAGWLEVIGLLVRAHDWAELSRHVERGLASIAPDLGFLLLEPLLDHDDAEFPRPPEGWLADLTRIIRDQPPNLVLAHSTGRLLRAHGCTAEATTWQEKALLLNPAFWPARLELLTMSMPEQQLTPLFAMQLGFLLERARQVKRFVCAQCGLKRREIFFCCPKCLSWHSISFRTILSD